MPSSASENFPVAFGSNLTRPNNSLKHCRARVTSMPVLDYLIGSEADVSETLTLEAKSIGLGFENHDPNSFIYGVGPKDATHDEIYCVLVKGSPREAMNEAFVTSARRLLSFNSNEEYPQTDNLDYAPGSTPPRPAAVNALTAAVTKNNGSGKNVPHIVPR